MVKRRSRIERSRERQLLSTRLRFSVIVVVALAALFVGVAFAVADRPGGHSDAAASLLASVGADRVSASGTDTSSTESTGSQIPVEVPSVLGLSIEEAELLLGVAGLAVVRTPTPAGDETSGTVLGQAPAAGSRVSRSTTVELVVADPSATREAVHASGSGPVVCIDPGHQSIAAVSEEPLGPGSTEMRPKVTEGLTGVATGQREHTLALALALEVRDVLEEAGVTVVMTRLADDVNISNAQRAAVANEAAADLFLRIHADFATNATLSGVATHYPSENEWVAPIETASLSAARTVQREVVAATGAKDVGLIPSADLVGFNHSRVPSILVQVGFLSNPAEDRQLADPAYRTLLAAGMARGVLTYLEIEAP